MSTDTPQSRAEHHADSDARTVRASRRIVHRALEAGHVGRANAITGAALSRCVPLKATTVRDIIADLRDDPAGPPIGNCADGYYIIDSRGELDDYVQSVREEIRTKEQRLEATVQAYNQRAYSDTRK